MVLNIIGYGVTISSCFWRCYIKGTSGKEVYWPKGDLLESIWGSWGLGVVCVLSVANIVSVIGNGMSVCRFLGIVVGICNIICL